MGEWDESAHPRGKDGKFGGGQGAFVAKHSDRYAAPLLAKAEKEGGFTYRPGAEKQKRTPTEGFMVSRDPSEKVGHVIEIEKMAMRDPPPTKTELHAEVKKAVSEWLAKSVPNMQKLGADHYLGGWMQKDKDGAPVALHLDISQHFDPRHKDDATKAGRDRNQMAIFDIGKFEEISTGGTGR